MAIKIGDAECLQTVSPLEIIPDDRQDLVKTIDGAYVVDNGCIANGDRLQGSVVLTNANWATVKGYWTGRTLVTVIDEDGSTLSSMRVVVKGYKRYARFPTYWTVNFELWRI